MTGGYMNRRIPISTRQFRAVRCWCMQIGAEGHVIQRPMYHRICRAIRAIPSRYFRMRSLVGIGDAEGCRFIRRSVPVSAPVFVPATFPANKRNSPDIPFGPLEGPE